MKQPPLPTSPATLGASDDLDDSSTDVDKSWAGVIKRYLPYALGVGVLWLALRPASGGPAPGTPAPDFSLPIVSGPAPRAFHLSGERGKPYLMEVFASWCGVCRGEAGTVAAAATARRARDVGFLGVSLDDSVDATKDTIKAWGIPFDVVQDSGDFAKAYSIQAVPTFVLVDAEGKVRHVASGALSRNQIESWLGEVGGPILEQPDPQK